jgi:hypothetical protein
MLRSRVAGGTFLHYPGAVLSLPGGGYTVGVPKITFNSGSGSEEMRWLPVLEEVRSDPNDPGSGPFSLASTGPERGLVALRINCPYQATTLTAYRVIGGQPGNAPQLTPVLANDGLQPANAAPQGGTPVAIEPAPSGDPSGEANTGGFNVGPYGLGKMYVGAGPPVRPFRRLISAQSLFRREVYAQ